MIKMRNIGLLAALLLGLLLVAPSASAQQGPQANCPGGGYPPCRPQGQPGAQVRDFGVFRSGENFDKVDCGFDPSSTATLTFNGAEAGTAPVGADGCTRFNVAIGGDRKISFNGRTFTGRCGPNAIVVAAPAAGGTRTVTNNFILSCASDQQGAAASRGGPLARTGLDTYGPSVAGAALAAGGAVLVIAARRRRRTLTTDA